MTHFSRLRKLETIHGGYPPPRDLLPSVVPGHDARQPDSYDNRRQPDIEQAMRELRAVERSGGRQRGKEPDVGKKTKPIGLRAAPGTVTTGALLGLRTPLILALPQNSKRKRFIISNLDTSAFVIYFAFGNSPNNLIPVAPGAVWDEAGSGIITEEIWVATSVAARVVGFYEAIEDANS